MNDKYVNSGALFRREKRTPNTPDMGGDITIGGDVLQYVLDNARSGAVKLEVSANSRMGRNGQSFTSLRVNIPYEVRNPRQFDPSKFDPSNRNVNYTGDPNMQRGYGGRPNYQGNTPNMMPTETVARQSHQRPIHSPLDFPNTADRRGPGAPGNFSNDLNDDLPF